MVEQYLI